MHPCISSIQCWSSRTVSTIDNYTAAQHNFWLKKLTRWLLALVKSGKTLRACPRCFALTADFHKYPTKDTDIRTASNMKWLCCMGRDLLEKPELQEKGKELFQSHSMHNIQVQLYTFYCYIFDNCCWVRLIWCISFITANEFSELWEVSEPLNIRIASLWSVTYVFKAIIITFIGLLCS